MTILTGKRLNSEIYLQRHATGMHFHLSNIWFFIGYWIY